MFKHIITNRLIVMYSKLQFERPMSKELAIPGRSDF